MLHEAESQKSDGFFFLNEPHGACHFQENIYAERVKRRSLQVTE